MNQTAFSRRDIVVALAVCVFAAAFFAWRMHSVIGVQFGSTLFGADHDENLVALQNYRYWGLGYAKHFGAVVWTILTVLPLQVVGIPASSAAIAAFSVALGLGHGAQYVALRGERFTPLACGVMVMLSMSAYAYVTAAAAIDIYGLAVAAIWIGLAIARTVAPRLGAKAGTWVLGVGAAIGGVVNIPTTVYVLVRAENENPDFRRIAMATAIALAISVAPLALFGALTGYSQQRTVLAQWSSFSHFFNVAIVRDYFAGASVFALVAPGDTIICRYLASDLAGVTASLLRMTAVLGWAIMIVSAVIYGLVRRDLLWRTTSICVSIAGLMIFYIYFAPPAVLLFAVQWLPGLILLIAPLVARFRAAMVLAAATLIASSIVNLPLLSTIKGLDRNVGCPPALQVNGGL